MSSNAPNSNSVLVQQSELLIVFEICRNHNNDIDVMYKYYTIRGLYKYVLDTIADKTDSEDVKHQEQQQHQQHQQQPQQQEQSASNTITYRERLGGYLHPRDMRRLVTPFTTQNEPSIIVRRHVLLMNYDPIRAIILRNRILLLVPDGADSILLQLEQRVRGTYNNNSNTNSSSTYGKFNDFGNSVFDTTGPIPLPSATIDTKSSHSNNNSSTSTDQNSTTNDPSTPSNNKNTSSSNHSTNTMDEWNEMASKEWVNLSFELQCTDAVLSVVGSILHDEVMGLQMTATNYIDRIIHHHEHELGDDPLTILRTIKDAAQLQFHRVKSFVQSMQRILDNDEDMMLMNVSRLITHPDRYVYPVPQYIINEESDEPELVLEGHLYGAYSLQNYCDTIQGQINTTKELIDQRLDATRNRLIFAELVLSVLTFAIALGTMIGSFFGMNLEFPYHLKELDHAFFRTIAYTSFGCILLSIIMILVVLFSTGTTIPFRFRQL